MSLMEDFIDDYMTVDTGNSPNEEVEEEVVAAENIEDVEACPMLPDGTEAIVIAQEPFKQPQNVNEIMLHALQNGINENSMLMQEMKSSIMLLKASTSRIEREGRELSKSISETNADQTRLSNLVVDLEFRFNELLSKEEESDHQNQAAVVAICHEIIKNNIDSVMATVEEKLSKIDKSISSLASKLEETRKDNPQLMNGNGIDSSSVVRKVNECIAKTEQNDKSIATAWVGLIASLLLIPIAFILGRFFS